MLLSELVEEKRKNFIAFLYEVTPSCNHTFVQKYANKSGNEILQFASDLAISGYEIEDVSKQVCHKLGIIQPPHQQKIKRYLQFYEKAALGDL